MTAERNTAYGIVWLDVVRDKALRIQMTSKVFSNVTRGRIEASGTVKYNITELQQARRRWLSVRNFNDAC